ncbi:MAG: hypothetical protein R8K20_11750 [Gallionellaceae bacterium]
MPGSSWLEQAQHLGDALSGGIDGFLNGTDGGGKTSTGTKNETVLLDQSQNDKRTGTQQSSGMSTQTMLLIGGGLLLVVALVMVKK